MREMSEGPIPIFGVPERDTITPGMGLVTNFDPFRGKLRIDGMTARHANRRQVWVDEDSGFSLAGEPVGGPDSELTTDGIRVFRMTDDTGEIVWGTLDDALPIQDLESIDTSVS